MSNYVLQVQDKIEKRWVIMAEGEAKSRRQYIRSIGGRQFLTEVVKHNEVVYKNRYLGEYSGPLKQVILDKRQYRIRKAD